MESVSEPFEGQDDGLLRVLVPVIIRYEGDFKPVHVKDLLAVDQFGEAFEIFFFHEKDFLVGNDMTAEVDVGDCSPLHVLRDIVSDFHLTAGEFHQTYQFDESKVHFLEASQTIPFAHWSLGFLLALRSVIIMFLAGTLVRTAEDILKSPRGSLGAFSSFQK